MPEPQPEFTDKLKFIARNFFFTITSSVAGVMFLSVFVYAFFTGTHMLPDHEVAPFMQEAAVEDGRTLPDIETVPLDRPHLSLREVEAHVENIVVEALSLDEDMYEPQVQKMKGFFTNDGYQQYLNFLKSNSILQSLRQQNLRMTVFIDEPAFLLNQGALQGRYRWLYEVPITVNYLPSDTRKYTPRFEHVNTNLKVMMQLGRVQDPEDPYALKVESWDIKSVRK